MKHIELFDTTLRDGEQAIGFDLTIEQKLRIFNILDNTGLNTIEIGMPNVIAESDLQKFVDNVNPSSVKSKICLLSRLVADDLKIGAKILRNFKKSRLQFLGIGSHIHLYKKMQINEAELFKLYSKSIDLVRDSFDGEISFILEDASRGELDFLIKQIEFLLAKGVNMISFADTVGCMSPSQVKNVFYKINAIFGKDILLSCHFHNDLGLATANSLTAIESGAVEIQCTSGGIGERCGNSSIEEIVGLLQLKQEYNKRYCLDVEINDIIANLTEIFSFLNKKIDPYKPLVGKYAFTTAAGIHQNGIAKAPESYSFFDPAKINRKLDFVINKLSSSKFQMNNQHVNLLKKEPAASKGKANVSLKKREAKNKKYLSRENRIVCGGINHGL